MTATETDLDVAQGEIKGFAATWAIGGVAKDVSGYVGHLQVRSRQGAFGSPALIDVSSIDGSNPPTIAMQPGSVTGKVSVRLPGELTTLLKRPTYYYDLWVINASDPTERVRLMWGKFNVSKSATDNTALVAEIVSNNPGSGGSGDGGFPGSGFATQAGLDALQASLDTLQGQVDDLPTGADLDAVQSAIDGVQEALADYATTGSLSTLAGRVSTLEGEASGYASESDLTSLQDAVTALSDTVDGLGSGGGGGLSSTPMPQVSAPADFTNAGLLGVEWDGLDHLGAPMPDGFLRARVQRAFVGDPTLTQHGPTIVAANEAPANPWTLPSGWEPYGDSTFLLTTEGDGNQIGPLADSEAFSILGPLATIVNDVGSANQEIAFTVSPDHYVCIALNLDDSVSGKPDCLVLLWQGTGPTVAALHRDGSYDVISGSATGSWAPVAAGGSFRLQVIGTALKLLDGADAVIWTASFPGWTPGGGTKVGYLLTMSVKELAAYSLTPPSPTWTTVGDLAGGGVHLVEASGTYRLQAESLAGDLGAPSGSVSVVVDPAAVDHVGRGLIYAPQIRDGDDIIIDVANGYLQFFQTTSMPNSIQIVPPPGGASVSEFWAEVSYFGSDTPAIGFEVQGGGSLQALVRDVLPLQSLGKAIKAHTNYLIHFFSVGGDWYYDWTDPAPDALSGGSLLEFGDVAAGAVSTVNFVPLDDPNYPVPRMLEIQSVSMSGVDGKSCGLRLYSNPDSAAADAGRAWGTVPLDGTDCLLDIPNLDTYARNGQVSLSKVVGTGLIGGATKANEIQLIAVLKNGGSEDLVGVELGIGLSGFRGSSS